MADVFKDVVEVEAAVDVDVESVELDEFKGYLTALTEGPADPVVLPPPLLEEEP